MTKPPSRCPNGHPLGPNQVLVGHVACAEMVDIVGMDDLTICELAALAALLRPARARVTGCPTPALSRDKLLLYLRETLTATPPEALTAKELRLIAAVVAAAADRISLELIANVIDFAAGRRRLGH